MKTKVFLITALCIGIFYSCEDPAADAPPIMIPDTILQYGPSTAPLISPNQFVVEYKAGLDESAKQELRALNNVGNYETCSCGSELELWTMVEPEVDIEELVTNLPDNDGEKDVEGDHQFTFNIAHDVVQNINFPGAVLDERIAPFDESAIKIAILDTGIDYDEDDFHSGFYETSRANGCDNELVGWNFVDNNEEIADDHGHGTYVAKIIASELINAGVNYQILPVKVFDREGSSSYWKIICAFSYLQQFDDLDIINASFGYLSLRKPQTINTIKQPVLLKELIDSFDSRTLVITSAGNDGLNTDGRVEHFPSGYASDNILAVGGYNTETPVGIATDSNYGPISIDVAAPFEFGTNALDSDTRVIVRGTSFSTAFSSAIIARELDFNNLPRGNPVEIKNRLLQQLPVSTNLPNQIKDGKYLQ